MSLWALFFGWPAGGIWPNLLASAVTAPAGAAAGGALVWWRARGHLRSRDEQHAAELTAHHAAIRADVAGQLAAHHQAVLRAVRAPGGPVSAGQPYLIGEQGPEPLFPPGSGGWVGPPEDPDAPVGAPAAT